MYILNIDRKHMFGLLSLLVDKLSWVAHTPSTTLVFTRVLNNRVSISNYPNPLKARPDTI